MSLEKNSNPEILLLTHYYPPLERIGSWRYFYFAQAIRNNNLKLTVITSKKFSIDGLHSESAESLSFIRVIECEYIPKIIESIINIFFDSKSVNYKNSSIKKNNYLTLWKSKFIVKLKLKLKYIRSLFGHFFDYRDLLILPFIFKSISFIRRNNLQNSSFLIVSAFSPPSTIYAGFILKCLYPKAKWIVDYRDLWSGNPHVKSKFDIVNSISYILEKKLIKKSHFLTTISPTLAKELSRLHNKAVNVIYNGFPKHMLNTNSKDLFKRDDLNFLKRSKIKLLYTGNLYGLKRDPRFLIKAIEELNSKNILPKIFLELYGHDIISSMSLINLPEKNKYISANTQVAYERSLELQRTNDILILIIDSIEKEYGTLTGKLYEYMASFKPILAIGCSDKHDMFKIINETKSGLCCLNDQHSIVKALEIICSEKFEFKSNIYNMSKYTRENQSNKFVEKLKEII
tara:strand:+ start:452 stop:1825 length:1374 start_codon:yes stop_codon:yes gene_type:complete